MAKSSKPRKKYNPHKKFTSLAKNRFEKLSPRIVNHLKATMDEKILKVYYGTANKDDTDTIGTHLAYGLILAQNFEQSEEILESLKMATFLNYKVRERLDAGLSLPKQYAPQIEEALRLAIDMLVDLTLYELERLENHFDQFGQKIVDDVITTKLTQLQLGIKASQTNQS